MTAHAAGVLCLAGRGTPPSSRGRGRAAGRGGRGGGARGRGGEAPAPVVGWGERIARGEEESEEAPASSSSSSRRVRGDRRGEARGTEGAWQHASPGQTRAWERSASSPLRDDEDYRIVDVAKRRGGRGGPSSRVRGGPSTKKTRDASSDSESDAGGAHSTSDTSQVGGIRVNKCFRDFTSRRNADKLIESGRVTINGATASSGDRVVPGDVVELNGETVEWETLNVIRTEETNTAGPSTSSSTQFKYVKYWKPRGVTCTTDVRDRSNIIDAVGYTHARLFPVGRLDKDSTGLILLTSDGRLPNAALRSGRRHDKTYAVTVDTDIRPRDMKTLSKGVVISTPVQRDRVDRVLTARTLPCEINVTGRRTIEITLREGRNRQIRRMLDAVGYRVTDLHRVEIMGIRLGGLKKGRWVECDVTEMDIIMRCIRAAEEAGVEGDDEGEEEDS